MVLVGVAQKTRRTSDHAFAIKVKIRFSVDVGKYKMV